jgi:hypothetical protein
MKIGIRLMSASRATLFEELLLDMTLSPLSRLPLFSAGITRTFSYPKIPVIVIAKIAKLGEIDRVVADAEGSVSQVQCWAHRPSPA